VCPCPWSHWARIHQSLPLELEEKCIPPPCRIVPCGRSGMEPERSPRRSLTDPSEVIISLSRVLLRTHLAPLQAAPPARRLCAISPRPCVVSRCCFPEKSSTGGCSTLTILSHLCVPSCSCGLPRAPLDAPYAARGGVQRTAVRCDQCKPSSACESHDTQDCVYVKQTLLPSTSGTILPVSLGSSAAAGPRRGPAPKKWRPAGMSVNLTRLQPK
jgi:hypothetical protein